MITKEITLDVYLEKQSAFLHRPPQVVIRQTENNFITLKVRILDADITGTTCKLKAMLPGSNVYAEASGSVEDNTVGVVLPAAFGRYPGDDGVMYLEFKDTQGFIATSQNIYLKVLAGADISEELDNTPYISLIDGFSDAIEQKRAQMDTDYKSLLDDMRSSKDEADAIVDGIRTSADTLKSDIKTATKEVQAVKESATAATERISTLENRIETLEQPAAAPSTSQAASFSYKDTGKQIWGASYLTNCFGLPFATLDDVKSTVEFITDYIMKQNLANMQLVVLQNQARINAILKGLQATALKDEGDQQLFANAFDSVANKLERFGDIPQEQLEYFENEKKKAKEQEAAWRKKQEGGASTEDELPYPGYTPYSGSDD